MYVADLIPLGAENAIPCRSLADRAGISQREVQEAVLQARANGVPICSGSRGYFLPRNAEEAFIYFCSQLNRLRSGSLCLRSVRDYIQRECSRDQWARLEQVEREMP